MWVTCGAYNRFFVAVNAATAHAIFHIVLSATPTTA